MAPGLLIVFLFFWICLLFLAGTMGFGVRRLFLLSGLSLISFSCLAFLEGLHLGKGFLHEMTFPSGFGTREMCQDLRSLGELIFSFLFSFLIVLENLLNRII